MSERPGVLHLGPDPSTGGGMAAALLGIFRSPLASRYRLDFIPTYRSPAPIARLAVFALALWRLLGWRLRGRGRLVHVHATVRGSAWRKAVCVLVAKATGARVVLQVHSGAGDLAAFARRRGLAPICLALRRADVVLAVSEASIGALREAGVGVAIGVVPNAVPAVPGVEDASRGDTEAPLIAYLGGFANPAKGSDVLIAALTEATQAAPELRVALAGPGEPPPAAVPLLRHDNVTAVGWLDSAAKDQLLREAAVFVMPSLSEGLPMALLEAMAYGLPVVASAAGGIPEVVTDEVDGLLVAPGDPAGLAAALVRLGGDPGLRRRLGGAARARSADFDEREVTARLDAVYAELLGGAVAGARG